MKKDNKKKYIFLLALLTIAISVLVCLYIFGSRTDTQPVSSGIRWDGNNITVARDKNEKYIAIPCFTDLSFCANQTAQKVNIYNPENNVCIMNFSIVLPDRTVIWESGDTYPGYGFHDIELKRPLPSGTYEARIITRCFTIDKKSELNGSSFKFKINVKGE